MWILVNGYSQEVEQHPNIGGLIQPRNWARAAPWVKARRPWAVDNDFTRFSPAAFRQLLEQLRAEHPNPASAGCLFVAVPDVYADWSATLKQWHTGHDDIWGYNMPLGLVVQDGAHLSNVPWRDFRTLRRDSGSFSGAIFIGGTTKWKYSEAVAAIIKAARRLGLWVHAGRCNSLKRLKYFQSLGVDSADGGGFSQFHKHLARGAPAAAAQYQPRLL